MRRRVVVGAALVGLVLGGGGAIAVAQDDDSGVPICGVTPASDQQRQTLERLQRALPAPTPGATIGDCNAGVSSHAGP